MNRIKHIKTILSMITIMCFGVGKSQNCADFFDLPNPVNFYNSFTNYPAGSVLHEFGDIKMINKNDLSNLTNPTVLDSLNDASIFGQRLFFKGTLIFDVSGYTSECKKVKFVVNTDSVYIDSYLYHIPDNQALPINIGDSIRISADNGHIVTGKFSTISFQNNTLSSPYSFLDQFCLEGCSNTEYCTPDFEYEVIDNKVTFTNTSSVTASEANGLNWSFTGAQLIQDDEISHTYSSIGKQKVCITYALTSCVNGTTQQKCDSVEILTLPNETAFLGKGDHFTLTPNDDGIQDYVDIQAGSKIFTRNGNLVIEINQDTQWTGTDPNNNQLGTGLYTVLYKDYTFNITLIR